MSDNNQYRPSGDFTPAPPPLQSPPGQGQGVAALVLGIISLLFCWTSFFAVIFVALSIVGIVLAISGKKKNESVGMPAGGIVTAGLVVCIIALIFSAIGFITCGVCVGVAACASVI